MIGDRTLQRVLRSERLVALTGDLVRAILWVLAGAVLALWLAYYVVLARNMVVELHMNDFGKFYYSRARSSTAPICTARRRRRRSRSARPSGSSSGT
jgi:hypothetical protein